ncbi:GIY-YIG nuclease family protein [Rhodococcus sp. MEB041]|uniref:GIY-YIG nuclease family protein n=1 Tax=Rhodococcus sp. MEB041 TaxID=3040323 RepID=UPI00254CD397|nr:GIY-YIG nuclease family protein [Rhodococcus sp. MEB041]
MYLFEAENHEAYIGISTDLRSRLKQHAQRHMDIAAFRLREVDAAPLELRSIERSLVHSAQKAGFTLRNREHAMTLSGESVIDAVVTPEEQAEWLRDPRALNATDVVVGPEYSSGQLAAHTSSFDRLQQHPRGSEIVNAVAAYLSACVPFPARTEGTFWTVSCFPGSSAHRITCISMAMLEMFYIWSPPKSGKLEVRMFVDGSRIPKRLFASRKPWRKLGRGVWLGPAAHKSAGINERTIRIDDVTDFASALELPGVADAAAHHALAVMRKRQSGYKPSHCPQLAAAAGASSPVRPDRPSTQKADMSPADEADDAVIDDDIVDINDERGSNAEAGGSSSDRKKFETFCKLDVDGQALRWLRELVASSIPDSSADAGANWGVTCLPSTKSGPGRRRLFTVNVGAMEVAYVVRDSTESSVKLIATTVVSRSTLENEAGVPLYDLAARNPAVRFRTIGYRAAAGDDISLSWALGTTVEETWSTASAVLVDSLRGTRSPYGKYHSPMLHTEALRTAR